MALDKRLVSPKEPPLFVLGVVLSAMCWAALTLFTLGIGLAYAVLVLGFVAMAHAVFGSASCAAAVANFKASASGSPADRRTIA